MRSGRIAITTLVLSLVFYFCISYIAMQAASQTVEDFFHFTIDNNLIMTFKHTSNIVPILFVLYRLTICIIEKKIDNIALYQCALMYTMKGILQFVTIVPGVDGIAQCANRTFVESMLQGNCVDMMFSGHTGLVYLLSKKYTRVFFVTFEAVLMVLSHQHYTSDVLVAVIVAQWIQYVVCKETEQKHDILHNSVDADVAEVLL
jgi:hypothetical protein|tara:strand:+ start:225 stop:833 length:609 start_codon:yes stop_codon:yes gene_type:complete